MKILTVSHNLQSIKFYDTTKKFLKCKFCIKSIEENESNSDFI